MLGIVLLLGFGSLGFWLGSTVATAFGAVPGELKDRGVADLESCERAWSRAWLLYECSGTVTWQGDTEDGPESVVVTAKELPAARDQVPVVSHRYACTRSGCSEVVVPGNADGGPNLGWLPYVAVVAGALIGLVVFFRLRRRATSS